MIQDISSRMVSITVYSLPFIIRALEAYTDRNSSNVWRRECF